MKIFKPGYKVYVEHTGAKDWVYERFDPDCEMNLHHQVYSHDLGSYLWVKDSEIHDPKENIQEQPKTLQSTQEFTFTLDDLAKACDTSSIGSQKFLELQRALINLK